MALPWAIGSPPVVAKPPCRALCPDSYYSRVACLSSVDKAHRAITGGNVIRKAESYLGEGEIWNKADEFGRYVVSLIVRVNKVNCYGRESVSLNKLQIRRKQNDSSVWVISIKKIKWINHLKRVSEKQH